ncbi:hypothetical protein L1987_45512 [Smallanthus sonchifolius]|uniref:Uncharacterized protein n=1 Tax=Smallanthus sonchifolius TaxID=185202 RepID=A0ACB9FX96_9ASTR|nr:hypothetical protein L1987_45512 [Smallanthus sonchifolius]
MRLKGIFTYRIRDIKTVQPVLVLLTGVWDARPGVWDANWGSEYGLVGRQRRPWETSNRKGFAHGTPPYASGTPTAQLMGAYGTLVWSLGTFKQKSRTVRDGCGV